MQRTDQDRERRRNLADAADTATTPVTGSRIVTITRNGITRTEKCTEPLLSDRWPPCECGSSTCPDKWQ